MPIHSISKFLFFFLPIYYYYINQNFIYNMGQKKFSKRPLSEVESSDDENWSNKKQKGRKSSEKEKRDQHKEKKQSKKPVLIDIVQEKDDNDKSQ